MNVTSVPNTVNMLPVKVFTGTFKAAAKAFPNLKQTLKKKTLGWFLWQDESLLIVPMFVERNQRSEDAIKQYDNHAINGDIYQFMFFDNSVTKVYEIRNLFMMIPTLNP